MTPLEFRADGTVVLTVVGPAEMVQAAVDSVPDMMAVEVLSVSKLLAGCLDSRLELTPRQLEAADEAVECGYYHEPQNATLEEVASRLGCSTGTAGELLRRAERTAMTHFVTSNAD